MVAAQPPLVLGLTKNEAIMFGVMHLRLTEAAQKGAHDALLCRGGAHTIPTITPAAVDSAHTGKSSGLPTL